MNFGGPVRDTIHALGWRRPAGNLDFKVTQSFGCTGVVQERAFGDCAHFHRAIDLGNTRCGADVLAAQDGVVHFAGRDGYDGAIGVVIDHGNGWWTGYWHLSAEATSVGAHVTKGQKIGTVGSTGNSTACHLHFLVKAEVPAGATVSQVLGDHVGKWIDPWPHLEQNVTVRPNAAGVNIRRDAQLGAVYAQTHDDGHIRRASDHADLGTTSTWRRWGGTVSGATYTVNGRSSNRWERIWIDGAYRFIASLLATKSAS